MAHGLLLRNADGQVIVSTEAPAFVYIGKATFTGSASYVADSPGVSKWFYRDMRSGALLQTAGPAVPNGVVQVTFGDQNTYLCSTKVVQLTSPVPDETAVVHYKIFAVSKPLVFVGGWGDVAGAVASIAPSGVVVGGKAEWIIKLFVMYPAGVRADVGNLVLYCFDRCENSTPSGHGMALYYRNGNLCYSTSSGKILTLRDALTVTGTSGATTIDFRIEHTLTTGNALTDEKPAFLATDWFRASVHSTGPAYGFWWSRRKDYEWACLYSGEYSMSVRQMAIGAGIRRIGATIDFPLAVAFPFDVGITPGSPAPNGNFYDQVTQHFPISIPVIDGVMYD